MDNGNVIPSSAANLLARVPLINRAAKWVLSGGACIFMLHRILPRGEDCYESELVTTDEVFSDFLDWISERYRIVPLEQIRARSGKTDNGDRPWCAITFDDGWLDNYVHAFPLLRRRRLPATIFLAVNFIGTARRFWQDQMWLCLRGLEQHDDRQRLIERTARHFPWVPPSVERLAPGWSLRQFLMTRSSQEAEAFVQSLMENAGLAAGFSDRAFLNWDEVREMQRNGISFGSHTLNHTLLTQTKPADASMEIQDSREELSGRLQEQVSAFSYPWGLVNDFARDAVRDAGYACAVTTHPGMVKETSDRWLLPRIGISNSVLSNTAGRFTGPRARLSFAKNVALSWTSASNARNGDNDRKRVKIIFVIDKITEWEGGTERQLRALIDALDRRYFDPELCFIFPTPELPKDTLPCPAHWVCREGENTPSFPRRLFRLARFLHRSRPQIVQTYFIEGIVVGILAAKLAGVPRIVASARNMSYWKRFRHRIAFRIVSRLAHKWQCNSRAVWDYTKNTEGVPPERIDILPNALDVATFEPADTEERLAMRRRLGLEPSGPVFVSVANLVPVKDIATLIEAAGLVRAELTTARFLIVGEGPLRAELEEQARRFGLAGIVHFVGRQENVRPYLAAADFGMLTSLSEGSSNSLLEYMAMGLPSIVSDIPPNRELVSEVLFQPGNPRDLADKINLLFNDCGLRAQLSREYRKCVGEFSMEKFTLRAQSFYSGLAAEVS